MPEAAAASDWCWLWCWASHRAGLPTVTMHVHMVVPGSSCCCKSILQASVITGAIAGRKPCLCCAGGPEEERAVEDEGQSGQATWADGLVSGQSPASPRVSKSGRNCQLMPHLLSIAVPTH